MFGLWPWLDQLHPRNVLVGLNQSKLKEYITGDDDKLRCLKDAFGEK
jgi:hypothetical protein